MCVIMSCWTAEETLLDVSWNYSGMELLAGGVTLPSQMFGWIRSMKSTEDWNFCSPSAKRRLVHSPDCTSLACSVIAPLHTLHVLLYCKLSDTCSGAALIGDLQHKVPTRSIFSNLTSNLPKMVYAMRCGLNAMLSIFYKFQKHRKMFLYTVHHPDHKTHLTCFQIDSEG